MVYQTYQTSVQSAMSRMAVSTGGGGSWKKFSTQRPGVGGSIFRENFFFPFLGNFFPDYEYWLILVYFSS